LAAPAHACGVFGACKPSNAATAHDRLARTTCASAEAASAGAEHNSVSFEI
jgi:hypothetical protein